MDVWRRTVWEQRHLYLEGLWITIEICLAGFLFALVVGLALALVRLYVRPLRWLAVLLAEFFRDTPIFVQLLWVTYVWPELFSWPNEYFTAGWVALGLQSGGYLSETFRAGIEGISSGQRDAGISLGMHPLHIMVRIVLPQAALMMAPSIMNQFLVVVKSSTLVSVITVPDLMHQALRQTNIWYEPLPIMTSIAIIYIAVVYALSFTSKLLTDRLRERFS